MAGGTIFRGRFIEENRFRPDDFGQFVTLPAAYILVRAPQSECCPLVVVEKRRLPSHAVVTLRTARDVPCGELLPVNILVAVFALRRCGLEIGIHQLRAQIGRLMAVDTCGRAMRSQQGELGLGVIKA